MKLRSDVNRLTSEDAEAAVEWIVTHDPRIGWLGTMPPVFEAYAVVPSRLEGPNGPMKWSEFSDHAGLPVGELVRGGKINEFRPSVSSADEGNLDIGLAQRIEGILAAHTNTPNDCYFHFCMMSLKKWEEQAVFRASLSEMSEVWEHPDVRLSPTHWWPDDRAWLVSTNYDLSYSVVGGTNEAIEELVADPELEAFVSGARGLHP
jgi:hypothetical protein